MPSQDRRVVITGMGLISPLGDSYSELWDSISNGRSGVDVIQSVPTEHFASDIGGECNQFTGDIASFGPLEKKLQRSIKKGLRLTRPHSQRTKRRGNCVQRFLARLRDGGPKRAR